MNEQGVEVPILLGGAALSKHYCESHLRSIYNGKVYHGRDAFEGLRIMDMLKEGKADTLEEEIEERLGKRADSEKKVAAMKEKKAAEKAAAEPVGAGAGSGGGGGDAGGDVPDEPTVSSVDRNVDVPEPPFWGDRLVEDVPLDNVYPFINEIASSAASGSSRRAA